MPDSRRTRLGRSWSVRTEAGARPGNKRLSRAAEGRRGGPLTAASEPNRHRPEWSWPAAGRPAWMPSLGPEPRSITRAEVRSNPGGD